MTEDEMKVVMEMVERGARRGDPGFKTLLVLLAEPRLPAELTPAFADLMQAAYYEDSGDVRDGLIAAYGALYAHLAKLKTKTVEVWRVEYAMRTGMGSAAIYTPFVAVYLDEAFARARAIALKGDPLISCIHVTGPHKQEVPA